MKPKIYYLHATQAQIAPTRGDTINEMATVRALARHFDVFYNGEKVNPSDQVFGRSDGRIVIPRKGQYDLVYVRANRDVFLAAPSPKITMATPYDPECFDAADGLVVTTEVWKRRLEAFSPQDADYFMGIYPPEYRPEKPIILFDQVFDQPDSATIANYRTAPLEPAPAPRKQSYRMKWLRTKVGLTPNRPKKVIAHLGPIKPTNFPHQLLQAYETNQAFRGNWEVRAYGPGKKAELPGDVLPFDRVSLQDAFRIFASVDATWMNHNRSVNFVGSLKTIHAMAFGTPIILPAFETPVQRVGRRYPLLWKPLPGQPFEGPQPDFQRAVRRLMRFTGIERRYWSGYLRSRAEHFSTERVAAAMRDQIEAFLASH